MTSRNSAIHKHLVRALLLGGLIAAPEAYAQDSAKQAAAPPGGTPSAPVAAPTPDQIRRGQDLFDGRTRFVNKGPSCNACHHVQADAVVAGGTLSTDLTQSFSRVGKEGLGAILGNAPFPVMQVAYAGKSLTADEVNTLVGFLQHADQQQQASIRQPVDIGMKMFGAGAAGVAMLMGFFGLVGRRRKKKSVNQDIYDRQLKSE